MNRQANSAASRGEYRTPRASTKVTPVKGKPSTPAAAVPVPEPAMAMNVSATDRARLQRIFLRGTNLLPTGKPLESCLAGSKQSILVDMLARTQGATMDELLEALSGGRKPWTEASVRSGFGWDLKNKGYGVRSEFDATMVERFHLVMPEGGTIPPHAPARKKK